MQFNSLVIKNFIQRDESNTHLPNITKDKNGKDTVDFIDGAPPKDDSFGVFEWVKKVSGLVLIMLAEEAGWGGDLRLSMPNLDPTEDLVRQQLII